MNNSDTISAIALCFSAISLSISLAIYIATLTRIKLSIRYCYPDKIGFVVANRSSKSICIINISLLQDDKIVYVNSAETYLYLPLPISPFYLSPYQATNLDVKVDLDLFDTSTPIRLCVETSRRTIFFSLDLSDRDNAKVYKHRKYGKHKTDNRKYKCK